MLTLVKFSFLVKGSEMNVSRTTIRGLAETASARRTVVRRLVVGNMIEEMV